MKYKKCSFCGKRAVENLRQYKLRLCKDCFINFYEKQVGKVLNKVVRKNEKVLVCVSGGKDSSAMLNAFSNFNFEFEALFIDLEIRKNDYSKKSYSVVKKLCNLLDVELNVVKVSEYNVNIEKFNKRCSACGTVKRYIMNKFARENGFDSIATGHTVDDIVTFFFKNWLSGNFQWSSKFLPRIEGFDKIVTKIRPLYYMSERENLVYCLCREIPFVSDNCPYMPRDNWKEIIYDIELKKPGFKRSFAINLVKMLSNFEKEKKEEEEKEKEGSYTYCKICGEITTSKSGICAFCKLKN